VFDVRPARARACQAYQFDDPFDTYNTASTVYETVSGTIAYSSSYARFAPPAGLPGQGIKINSFGAYVRKNMQSNQGAFVIFLAVNFASLGSSGAGGNPFLTVYDSGTSQWSLVVFSSGALGIIRGNTGAVQTQTGPGVVATGQWYGIELQVTVASTLGAAQVYLGGVQIINATNMNTQQSGNSWGNQVAIGDINNNGLNGAMLDDFRVWDTTGSTQNALVGRDRRLVAKVPTGAGALTTWTPNGAAANWQCVDETPPDGDTSYVSSTGTNLDSYAMPSAGFTGNAPTMVVARSLVRKDDANTRTFQNGVRSSSTNGLGSGTYTVTSTYAYFSSCIPLDPNGSIAWTAATADAAQHLKYEAS
jgi:hypothetical protein